MKKAQGLPINIVVMIIIGLFIFGMGIAMFARFSASGDDTINDLNNRIKTDIASLECDGDKWICSGTYKVRMGDNAVYQLFLANQELDQKVVKVRINTPYYDTNKEIYGVENGDCGFVTIVYPNIDINLKGGNSAEVPFQVGTSNVAKKCNFITTAYVEDLDGQEIGRTAVIIKVE